MQNLFVTDPGYTDHFAVHFNIPLGKPAPSKVSVTSSNIKNMDKTSFQGKLSDINTRTNKESPLSELVTTYNDSITSLLDEYAPTETKTFTIRPNTKWYNSNLRQTKVIKRRLERKWKKSQLQSDWETYRVQCNLVSHLLNKAKTELLSNFN